jgi:trk system potassium uptake protein TrkA
MLKVLIVGGGTTGFELAKLLLEHDIHVHLLEQDKHVCEVLSEQIPAEVFCGDAKVPHHLEEAGIKDVDVVIVVTNNEATNLLIATLANVYKVNRVLVFVRDPNYIEVCQKIGITEIIDTAHISAQYILAHLRGFELVQIIEKIIQNADVISLDIDKDSPHCNEHIKNINFPSGDHLIAILRDNSIEIPESNTKLQEADKLIFIHKKTLKESLAKFLGR